MAGMEALLSCWVWLSDGAPLQHGRVRIDIGPEKLEEDELVGSGIVDPQPPDCGRVTDEEFIEAGPSPFDFDAADRSFPFPDQDIVHAPVEAFVPLSGPND